MSDQQELPVWQENAVAHDAAERDYNEVQKISNKNGSTPMRKTMLKERLDSQRFLILYEDGQPSVFRVMTLRELYEYAMKAITTRPCDNMEVSFKWSNMSKSAPSLRGRSFRASLPSPQLRSQGPADSSGRGSGGRPDPPPLSLSATSQHQSSCNTQQTGTPLPPVHEGQASVPPAPASSIRLTTKAGESSILTQPDDEQQAPANIGPTTYRERLGGYLHPRDMRRLVTPFSSTNEPELIIRRHVMLLNFDKLRAIVLRDRLLIRVPDGADSMLIMLEKRVRGGAHAMEKEAFGEESSASELDWKDSTHSWQSDFVKKPVMEMWERARHKHSTGGDSPTANDDKISTTSNKKTAEEKKTSSTGKPVSDSTKKTSEETRTAASSGDGNGDGLEDDQADDIPDFLRDSEMEDIKDMDWIQLPFELQCVDAVLYTVCELLSEDSLDVRRKAYVAMAQLVGETHSLTPGDHAQEKLRALKDDVKEMKGRVRAFVRALDLVLDEDEDMALMNLSRLITNPERFIKPVPSEILEEESDEPELILEAYMQQALSIENGLEQMTGQIGTTEELVEMKMDTVRNRLLYINTLVSVMSLCVATASLVGSIFGMNLTNHLETDETAFRNVVVGTLVGTFCFLVSLLYMFHRAGNPPKRRFRAPFSLTG